MSDEMCMSDYNEEEVFGMECDDAGNFSCDVQQVSVSCAQIHATMSSNSDKKASLCLLCNKDTSEHVSALSRGTETFLQ